MKGLVIKSMGLWYVVKHNDTLYSCRLKGRFRMHKIKSTNPITVGDYVDFEIESNDNTGVIRHIYDRKNYIIRKSVNLSKQTHIIASNIDQAFLLITIDNPPTSTDFIDRFLASAEAYQIPVTLVFNKIDLYSEKSILIKEQLKTIYTDIGYKCIETSAITMVNIDLLKNLMKNKVSLFSGHSGVGKSTLANAIDSSLDLKTNKISDQYKQGQHTTTFATMFSLPFGGYLIDTPGIKGFGVVDFEKNEISNYFPEFFALKKDCKFHNCLHINEPKCAIKNALETKKIAASRYKSYLQIIHGDEKNYRVDEYNLDN